MTKNPDGGGDEWKILRVDDQQPKDDPANCFLQDYDVRLLKARNGAEGMSIVMHDAPDLIIADVNMPQGDGETLIHAVYSDNLLAHIPVIALSSLHDPELGGKLRELGAVSVLFKPVNVERMIEEIQKWIPIKRSSGAFPTPPGDWEPGTDIE